MPYYEPAVVYGSWDYPEYPPYYFPPAPGWVVGGAIATGIAWGAGIAIGNAIWDGFDWHDHNINVDIDKNVNINKHVNKKDVKQGKWEHNPQHRKGVNYKDKSVQNKFGKDAVKSADRKLDYRGRSGEQVLKPDKKGLAPATVPATRGKTSARVLAAARDLTSAKARATASGLSSARIRVAPASRPPSTARSRTSASRKPRASRSRTPSMPATAPRRATTQTAGRRASATAVRVRSPSQRAAADRR